MRLNMITVPNTYAAFHIGDTAECAGAAADNEATNKTNKYARLTNTHH